MNAPDKPTSTWPTWTEICVSFAILFVFLGFAVPNLNPGMHSPEQYSAANAHNLAVALFQYSTDNNGVYPNGASSTEVFQKLYDGNYLVDPANLLLSKLDRSYVSAAPPVHLPAHYPCWDTVTAGNRPLDSTDSTNTPLVISTGLGPYAFQSGTNAVVIAHPDNCAWGNDGVTISYLDTSSRFVRATGVTGGTATVKLTETDFAIPPNTSYHTLTP